MIFGRKRGRDTDIDEIDDVEADHEDDPVELKSADGEPGGLPAGPWDAADVDEAGADSSRIDLGGLLIKGRPDTEVQLQVDQASGGVLAVLVVAGESALELRAFAAPRSAGIWADVRREIAAEATRQGGTASESAGPFGSELKVVTPARTPEGAQVTQVSRIVGIDGPRWLLRGTFMGRAVDPAAATLLEDVFRDVVVVRGSAPMAPRDPLPLVLPASAQLPGDPPAGPSAGAAADPSAGPAAGPAAG